MQKQCRDPGSNRGPLDLQSNALPTELSRLIYHFLSDTQHWYSKFKFVVLVTGNWVLTTECCNKWPLIEGNKKLGWEVMLVKNWWSKLSGFPAASHQEVLKSHKIGGKEMRMSAWRGGSDFLTLKSSLIANFNCFSNITLLIRKKIPAATRDRTRDL